MFRPTITTTTASIIVNGVVVGFAILLGVVVVDAKPAWTTTTTTDTSASPTAETSTSSSPSTSSYPTQSTYPTSSSAPSLEPTQWTRPPVSQIYYPIDRYVEWDSISDVNYAASAFALGWKEKTWNVPGSYTALESLSYESLTQDQQNTVTNDMNMNELTYDCYINHYDDYDWYELELYDIAKYFTSLGWTQTMWDCTSNGNNKCTVPTTEDLDWNELSTIQKQAAIEVCFFEELWMEYELGSKEW